MIEKMIEKMIKKIMINKKNIKKKTVLEDHAKPSFLLISLTLRMLFNSGRLFYNFGVLSSCTQCLGQDFFFFLLFFGWCLRYFLFLFNDFFLYTTIR